MEWCLSLPCLHAATSKINNCSHYNITLIRHMQCMSTRRTYHCAARMHCGVVLTPRTLAFTHACTVSAATSLHHTCQQLPCIQGEEIAPLVSEEALLQLVSMSFEVEAATRALRMFDNSVERAADWLVSNPASDTVACVADAVENGHPSSQTPPPVECGRRSPSKASDPPSRTPPSPPEQGSSSTSVSSQPKKSIRTVGEPSEATGVGGFHEIRTVVHKTKVLAELPRAVQARKAAMPSAEHRSLKAQALVELHAVVGTERASVQPTDAENMRLRDPTVYRTTGSLPQEQATVLRSGGREDRNHGRGGVSGSLAEWRFWHHNHWRRYSAADAKVDTIIMRAGALMHAQALFLVVRALCRDGCRTKKLFAYPQYV